MSCTRLLEPGGEAAIVDCFTDRFDPGDAHHADLRARIEKANAAPNLPTYRAYGALMESAGFELFSVVDQQAETGNPETPWYMALEGWDLSLASLARVPAGRALTAVLCGS